MIINNLVCQASNECILSTVATNFNVIIYAMVIGMSAIGIVNNLICTYIFSSGNNMNNSFFRYMNAYSINSLLINLNDFIVLTLFFAKNKSVYYINFFGWYEQIDFPFYYTYIYLIIWTITYTFGSLLDSFILYTRVQIFHTNIKLFANTLLPKVIIGLIVLSIVINIPVNIQRTTVVVTFNVTKPGSYENMTMDLYTYGSDRFKGQIYVLFTYLTLFVRDILTFFLEGGLNIFLVVSLKKYLKMKMKLLGSMSQQQQPLSVTSNTSSVQPSNMLRPPKPAHTVPSQNNVTPLMAAEIKRRLHVKRSEEKNVIIAIVLCILSSITHVLTFVTLYFLIRKNAETYIFIGTFSAVLNSIRHSVDIFVFLGLNKKFKDHFMYIFCHPSTTANAT